MAKCNKRFTLARCRYAQCKTGALSEDRIVQCYRFETCQIISDVPFDQPGHLSKSIGSTKLFHLVNSLVPLGQLSCSIGST